jgi:hypothetical protein
MHTTKQNIEKRFKNFSLRNAHQKLKNEEKLAKHSKILKKILFFVKEIVACMRWNMVFSTDYPM